ncbi:hypothetical protein BJY04DRAFT_24098 [Aspergillus karnatakaensis]|uniref:uncharacterized protein n=1 Tax=Aspergillus karnatakaensis TaxID=1810916 RepID=UPI003CCD7FC9
MSDYPKRGSSDESRPPDTQRSPDSNDISPPDSEQTSRGSQSLASRIQRSASELARNAFLPSTASADTAHLLSDSSKAAPSSSSALAAAEQYRESGGSSSSSARAQTSHVPTETFRSQPSADPGGFHLPGLTEDEFQASYGDDMLNSGEYTGKGKGKAIQSDGGSGLSSYHDGITAAATLLPSDGDAVVSILSDKTFDPEFPPTANEPPEYLDTEPTPPQLTPAEVQMIESFRRQLPQCLDSQRSPEQSRQLNPQSLVPDIGSFLDSLPASTITPATTLRDSVLTSLPGAADWISVEERYHDEVWGYLQPSLEAAAKEIESNKDSPGSEYGPAVRRLKMILQHMQQ